MKADRIEREIVVPHSRQQVWAAVTDAESLSQWFGDVAEVDLRPGGAARFGWTEYDSHAAAVIEIVDQPTTFAFRWSAIPNVPMENNPSTLVTISLEEVASGTKITVVESGLSLLPDELYDKTLEDNSSGWESELTDLGEFLARPVGTRQ